MVHVCEDEYQLYYNFFTKHTGLLEWVPVHSYIHNQDIAYGLHVYIHVCTYIEFGCLDITFIKQVLIIYKSQRTLSNNNLERL